MSFQLIGVIWLTPSRELLAMRACGITVEGKEPPPHEFILGVEDAGGRAALWLRVRERYHAFSVPYQRIHER
jgi:hypothetical protein